MAIGFPESVRTKTGMYLGNNEGKGIINLICGQVKDCISLCQNENLFVEVSILTNGKFTMKFNSKTDLSPFFKDFKSERKPYKNYHTMVLAGVANKLEILTKKCKVHYLKGVLKSPFFSNADNSKSVTLNFNLDNAVFKDTNVDYQNLSEELLQIALLNRGIEILVKDARQKYHSQNYYCLSPLIVGHFS